MRSLSTVAELAAFDSDDPFGCGMVRTRGEAGSKAASFIAR